MNFERADGLIKKLRTWDGATPPSKLDLEAASEIESLLFQLQCRIERSDVNGKEVVVQREVGTPAVEAGPPPAQAG